MIYFILILVENELRFILQNRCVDLRILRRTSLSKDVNKPNFNCKLEINLAYVI